MNIEKMREDFEAWECDSDHGPQTDPVWLMYDAKTNTYPLDEIQARWVTWQASRAALVIELPSRVSYENRYDGIKMSSLEPDHDKNSDEAFALVRAIDVIEAIEAAGVKVKP